MLLIGNRGHRRRAFVFLGILGPMLALLLLLVPWVQAAPGANIDPLTIEGSVAAAFNVRSVSQVAARQIQPLNIPALRLEDEARELNGQPPRFALPQSTWLIPAESGTWEDLDENYQLWRLRISAPGVLSLNLGFTGYHLPAGARLSLYPTDVTGPKDRRGVVTFTSLDNEDHGQLWTPVILADDIVIELVLPRAERHNYRLELTAINLGYRYFGEELVDFGVDKSGSCNVDVVCPEGDPWRLEISSVGVISTGGSTFCTGTMLNNTAQDGTPYFLTANHCGIDAANAASLIVYWNFQSVNCGDQGGGLLNQFMTGATFLAAGATSDFTLVQMDDPVDPAHGISFAGWDRTTADPSSATTIHHPNGDEKSISFEYDQTSTASYLDDPANDPTAHIKVTDWDLGTTEPGSSGAPLFDQNHHVVGQLEGGMAACNNNEPDWFGRLSTSWPGLAPYLDPLNTGQTSLVTYAPQAAGIMVDGLDLNGVGNVGGPFLPTATVYTVRNVGSANLDYQVTTVAAWLDIANGSGTLAAGAAATVTVAYNAAANLLSYGEQAATLDFIDLTGGEGNVSRPVQLQVGIPELVYGFDLATDPGWAMDGDWAYGAPIGGGGEHGNTDPTAGFTGSNVLGFNLAGDYSNNLAETHLVTRAIDCSGLSGTHLRFWRWLNVEQPLYDHASIAVSTDSVNFTSVWANTSEVVDTAWAEVSYDISAIADHHARVFVRWTMGTTDASFTFSGWNLDDIEIWGVQISISGVQDVPGYQLGLRNYPNPFNPLTRINYVLAQTGEASVRVYDLQGRLVRELVKGILSAGSGWVVWDGTDRHGLKVASGVYFAQIVSGGQRADHKMILLK